MNHIPFLCCCLLPEAGGDRRRPGSLDSAVPPPAPSWLNRCKGLSKVRVRVATAALLTLFTTAITSLIIAGGAWPPGGGRSGCGVLPAGRTERPQHARGAAKRGGTDIGSMLFAPLFNKASMPCVASPHPCCRHAGDADPLGE